MRAAPTCCGSTPTCDAEVQVHHVVDLRLKVGGGVVVLQGHVWWVVW